MDESPIPVPPLAYAGPQPGSEDASHLKVLAICHWVLGGLTILFGFFPIVHITMGIMIVNGKFGPPPSTQNSFPGFDATFGWLFIVMGSFAMLLMWAMGILIISSGVCIHRRRKRMFSVVIAAITCAWFPIGTVLGVFTLMVLFRESVKQLYATPPLASR